MPNKDAKKHKENMAAWYQANKETVKERSRKRYQEKHEEVLKRQTEYREKNAEVLKEKSRVRYQENREESIARTKAYAAAHPEWRKEVARRATLKVVGWTPEKYDVALLTQNSLCAICGKPEQNRSTLSADHDHERLDERNPAL